MRDILTFLAGLLILVLVAAVAAPPFIDWRTYRDSVDDAISRAAGVPVSTEGTLEVRLLPSPRVKIDRMRVGSPTGEGVSLNAQFVKAEIALTPLLGGEVRFLASRVGRMEVRLPIGTGGEWLLPRSLLADPATRRAWVFEDLSVSQLLVTTLDPRTGRTDQLNVEDVQLQSQSLIGPWRAAGRLGATALTVATGPIATDEATALKVSIEKPKQPRLTFDGRLRLASRPDEMLAPDLDGALRLVAPPDGSGLPLTASATLKSAAGAFDLSAVSIESGSAGSVRLTGSGRLNLAEPRVVLDLEGRRLDLDALFPAGGAPGVASWPTADLPVDLALKLESATFRGEEATALTLQGSLAPDQLTVRRLEFTGSGETQVVASGTVGLSSGRGADGAVSLSSPAPEAALALIRKLGIDSPPAGALASKALTASADVVVASPVVSLRNIRVNLGETALSGALRYTDGEGGGRPRVDAQLALRNLDLADYPAGGSLGGSGGLDLGLTLDAREIGYRGSARGGRVAARVTSDGSALDVERLEVTDLAGANARASGRIAPDGSGSISGRLSSGQAGPLLDIASRFWLGGAGRFLPAALRDSALDVAITIERPKAAAGPRPLSVRLDGTAANATVRADATSAEGRLLTLRASVATERAGGILRTGRLAVGAVPLRVELSSGRDSSGRLTSQVTGVLAGVSIRTTRPVALSADDGTVEEGAFELSGPDAAPLLPAGLPKPSAPLAMDMKAEFSRRAGVPRGRLTGRVSNVSVDADLFGPTLDQLGGTVALGSLSVPWLAGAALGNLAGAGAGWSSAAFGPAPSLPLGGTVTVKAAALDLGRGYVGRSAELTLSVGPDGVAVRDLTASVLDGSVAGELRLNRQGASGSAIGNLQAIGISVPALLGWSGITGQLSGELRFGGSGESVAAVVGNLGGVGRLHLEGFGVPAADGAAVLRTAQRALRGDDPLNQPRLLAVATEELGRGGFAPGTIEAPASLVNGALRFAPITAESDAASWVGSAVVDLRNVSLDVRGALTAKALPRNWTGAAPYLGLGWSGPTARPVRQIDVGPLANGLAAVVLARELDRIETFELDAAERARINARVEMDRARRLAAEEAARIAKQREEAERARQEAERILNSLPAADPGAVLRPGDPLPLQPVRPPVQPGATPRG